MNVDSAMIKENAIHDVRKRIPIVDAKMSKKNRHLDMTKKSGIVDATMTSQCKMSINRMT